MIRYLKSADFPNRSRIWFQTFEPIETNKAMPGVLPYAQRYSKP